MSAVSSGQPSVEYGHRHELNHVSSTSVSCVKAEPPHFGHFFGTPAARACPSKSSTLESVAGTISWQLSQCHTRSEEHTSELQSPVHNVCRLLPEKKNISYAVFCLKKN